MTDDLKTLGNLLDLQAVRFGRDTPIEGLRLTRTETPMEIRSVYRPSFCAVLQGSKISMLGESALRYGAGQGLLASVDVPVTARIVEASPERPYLAFSVEIDPAMVAEMLPALADEAVTEPAFTALHTDRLDAEIMDPLGRLLRLLDTPRDIPVMAPLVKREITWRLLNGSLGPMLRHVGLRDSQAARIGRATAWIRDHFREPLRVPDLVERAGMSVASFHRHFKAVTTLSPVQFQKLVRLQEARRMLLENHEVAAVGYAIGYESASHFNRDYRRQFGAPPGRDIAAIRALVTRELA
jgi:AraC-like DNA-binding protein